MPQITITEALSEINLVKKKIEGARTELQANLVRAKHISDPYDKEGGTAAHNMRLIQSIEDQEKRLVRIRSAIARANVENSITAGGETKSIHDWLTWRRELMGDDVKMYNELIRKVRTHNETTARQPQVYKDKDDKTHLVEYEVNVDLPSVIKKAETLQEIEEKLDGQLSLKNATILIEV